MSAIPIYNITVHQGQTWEMSLFTQDENGAPKDLTGYTARMQVRDRAGGAILLDRTVGSGIAITAPDGQIAVSMTAVESAALAFSKGVYDLLIQSGTGTVTYLCGGDFVVEFEGNGMKLVVIEKIGTAIEAQKKTTTLVIAPFDTGMGAVLKDVIESKGDVLVGSGVAAVDNLAPGPDGYVLTLRSISPLGVQWEAPQGGGVVTLRNNSAYTADAGDVAVHSTTADAAFALTTIKGDPRVLGVVAVQILSSASGEVGTVPGFLVSINCDTAAVNRGDFLITSSTRGKATSGGGNKVAGSFAVAMTGKAAGTEGAVTAILVQGFTYRAVGAMGGYAMFGTSSNAQGGAQQYAQKFGAVTGAWSALTNLIGTARWTGTGTHSAVAAYTAGGQDPAGNNLSDGEKIVAATDMDTHLTGCGSTLGRKSSGANFDAAGYAMGGVNATVTVGTIDRNVFSTEIWSILAAAMATALSFASSASDGVQAITAIGGTGTTGTGTNVGTAEKFVQATETSTNQPSANCIVDTGMGRYHQALSLPSAAGYWGM